MANNMIKFYRGLVNNLPTSGVEGALYITTDEGAIYYGTGTGMKRLGDFIQVANVAALPAQANESCLYYCVAENILAKWNGSEWTQINKQPTAEELKGLLGLGSIAYLSEVAEDNLSAALKEKVNAASEGNHSHNNKGVIDGITAEKVAAWDASEQNAKDYADGLNGAMNTRVEALEAIDHEHANKALLDTYTQTEANLADAVAKKHAHANATELDKIAAGDVQKWNNAVADHLTSVDKTALEDSIGDVNTALENYKTSNNEALAGVKATADAAATKTYTDEELAKKADKSVVDAMYTNTQIDGFVQGAKDYADDLDSAMNTRVAGLEAKFGEGDGTVEAQIAAAVAVETAAREKAVSDEKSARETAVAGVQSYAEGVAGRVTTAEGKITALETESAKHALKTELEAVDKKFEDYTKTSELPTDLGDFTNNAGYAKTADVNTELDNKADKTQVATDIANAVAPLATTEALNGVDAKFANYTNTTDMNAKFDLKADKSVVEAMYTNTQIDGFIAEAKKYADDNDADTKYGIVYDSENKKIKLVEGGTDVEIDASAFIKDGMISNVTIGDDNDLIITFNTDAGKENIVLPLDQLVDIYTGVEGDRIKVTVNADKSISADLVAGSIGKDYLDEGVKASLALADSAIQAHQDISHLATTEALNGVDAKFANYKTAADQKAIDDEQDRRLGVIEGEYLKAADIANFETKENVKKVADDLAAYVESNDAAVALKANSADVYAKSETYTKSEIEALLTWGSF